ncbi:MAG TPA: hypothetical protein VM452_04955 [Caulifigura sp.]|jgi:hypothetical protein|nr:hypothetical protein [Caulifigura sp.]
MSVVLDQLREDELARMFSDWATPVLIRRVDQGLDSDFDEVSESDTNFEIEAVLLPGKTDATARTGLQHVTASCDFLIRAADVPAGLALTACRLIVGQRAWAVVGITRSADGRVIQLHGQST